jgi:hypothetical protein
MMPAAERLLLLYPRAWRERYGEEFLATVGPGALRPPQVIDIVSGAIDAWLSADVRGATRASRVGVNQGGLVVRTHILCHQPKLRVTTRDAWIGAGAMTGGTLLFATLGVILGNSGWPVTGEVLTSLAFTASLTLSMPFWLMKGQPWRAQVVITVVTLAVLVAIGYLASAI